MLKNCYVEGRDAALAYFKLASPTRSGLNTPSVGQIGAAQNAALKPPGSASPPIAAGAAKSQVLG